MKTDETWTVVVVDDEPDILEVIFIVLEDRGFSVVTAENGRKGLDACRSHGPQIVITDVRMPQMGGLDLLRQLKSEMPGVEVVVMTAFGELDYAIDALHMDASDFITKPLNPETLDLALKRAQDRYTTRRQLKAYTRFLEQANISQARLLHRDKMISLGRLSASVVHEINNPLAGMLNYAKLMQRILDRDTPSSDELARFRRYLDLMASESRRISTIVSSLLAFSRKNKPRKEPVSVSELVDKCVLLSRHRLEMEKIELALDIADDIPMIQADAGQLQQCIINLVFNGVDALSGGGKMTIRAGTAFSPRRVFIQVEDNGPGMSREVREQIFEPFFTTKPDGYGVGLGLSIVYGIMEHHGGDITVSSEPGSGTCFTLNLPFSSRGQKG